MREVLVYIDPSINDRLVGFARSLADAAGRDLVALVAGNESVEAGRLPGADVVLEVSDPALSPYLPEAHEAVLAAAIEAKAPDLVLLENTTAGYDLGASAAAKAGLPFIGYCFGATVQGGQVEATSGIYGGQLHATLPPRRCRWCWRSTPRRCPTSRTGPAAGTGNGSTCRLAWTTLGRRSSRTWR